MFNCNLVILCVMARLSLALLVKTFRFQDNTIIHNIYLYITYVMLSEDSIYSSGVRWVGCSKMDCERPQKLRFTMPGSVFRMIQGLEICDSRFSKQPSNVLSHNHLTESLLVIPVDAVKSYMKNKVAYQIRNKSNLNSSAVYIFSQCTYPLTVPPHNFILSYQKNCSKENVLCLKILNTIKAPLSPPLYYYAPFSNKPPL